jgi:hypothetical protein
LDDKIVAAWNGLMISAFARGAMAAGEDHDGYIESARRAAEFVREKMWDGTRLLRSYREGPGPEGFADDYAAMTAGALDLYEATGEITWLQWAVELHGRMEALFGDAEFGGYFSTRAGDGSILVRLKEDHDGAEPAASSLAARNGLRLARMLDNEGYAARADATVAAFGLHVRRMPASMPGMLSASLLETAAPVQIVIANGEGAAELARTAREMAGPETVLLYADGGDGQAWLAERLEFIRNLRGVDGRAAVYVCENFACRLPVTDAGELRRMLR